MAGLRVVAVLGLAVAMGACSIVPGFGRSRPAPGSALSELAWIAGCWERSAGDLLTEEQWMGPAGGLMMGMSRTVRGDRLVEFESLRIQAIEGKLVYTASPSGQAPVEFRADPTSGTTVVFSNPANDFPSLIGYRAAGSDSLYAWIEGRQSREARRVDIPMRRVPCWTPAR